MLLNIAAQRCLTGDLSGDPTFKLIFPARHGVNFPCQTSTAVLCGVLPVRQDFFPIRPGSTAQPLHGAAQPSGSTVERRKITAQACGIVPAARNITAAPLHGTGGAHHHTVLAWKIYPAPHGMRPAAHGEGAAAPQTALFHPMCHFLSLSCSSPSARRF